MNSINVTVVATAIMLALSTAALAQEMSNDDYKAAMQRIVVDGKSAPACDSLSANAKDVCMAEAVAKAELEARSKPGARTRHDVRVAKAEADYSIAREKCDDMAGNVSQKRDADYAVAIRKCDAYAGGAEDDCVQQAKVHFGKS